jgi:hypothetical protein
MSVIHILAWLYRTATPMKYGQTINASRAFHQMSLAKAMVNIQLADRISRPGCRSGLWWSWVSFQLTWDSLLTVFSTIRFLNYTFNTGRIEVRLHQFHFNLLILFAVFCLLPARIMQGEGSLDFLWAVFVAGRQWPGRIRYHAPARADHGTTGYLARRSVHNQQIV